MNEEELWLHAEHMMQATDLTGYTYDEVVKVLTVAQYVWDLCVKELEVRGELTFFRGAPVIPDVRPPSMIVEHILIRP